jgi:hypothetical protein
LCSTVLCIAECLHKRYSKWWQAERRTYSALKHKMNLNRPHRSNSSTIPSQLPRSHCGLYHGSTNIPSISTVNNWKRFYTTQICQHCS